jgi:predicted DsbA family dithiol-disulfide isomerase
VNAINELSLTAAGKDIDFRMVRVPFFLEPDYISKPDSFRESHEQRMVRKFGSVAAFNRVKAAHGLIPRGAEVGLDESVGFTQDQLDLRIQSATLNSHRLVLFVTQQYGLDKAEAVYDQLNARHFFEAGALNDRNLLSASVEAVLDGEALTETLQYLESDRGKAETLQLYEQTQRMGIDSIPTFVIDGKYVMSGAARADEIKEALLDAITAGVVGGRAFTPAVIV